MPWRLFTYLLSLSARKYWGDVLITYKGGKLVTVRATQQYTDETLPAITDDQRAALEPADRDLLAQIERPAPRRPALSDGATVGRRKDDWT